MNLGDKLARMGFEGHKKRKRDEEREKAAFAPKLRRAFEAALPKWERDAFELGECHFSFDFECENNVHWFPEDDAQILDALPEELKEMREDKDGRKHSVTVARYKNRAHSWKIMACTENEQERLIAEADEQYEQSGEPYWKA